jgi:hypothetical protein
MRNKAIMVAILLSGCTSNPTELSSMQSCGVSEVDGWRQTNVPASREDLMQLVPTNENVRVREHLADEETDTEAWFMHSDGRLLVCAYTLGKDSCGGGSVLTVEFYPNEGSWKAMNALVEVCVTHNKRLQNDRQNARRFASLPLVGGV